MTNNVCRPPLIVEVLTAANSKAPYLDCVTLFIEYVLALESGIPGVRYEPKVVFVGDTLPPELAPFGKYIELLETDLPSSFVAQNCRSLTAGQSLTADFVIISDVDLLPLTARVFDLAVRWAQAEPDCFIALRGADDKIKQIPISYNLARPHTWRKVTRLDERGGVGRLLEQLWVKARERGWQEGRLRTGWWSDQEFLYAAVQEFSDRYRGRVVLFSDDETGLRRLRRGSWRGRLRWLFLPAVMAGAFSEYSVHYPVSDYRKFLGALKVSVNFLRTWRKRRSTHLGCQRACFRC